MVMLEHMKRCYRHRALLMMVCLLVAVCSACAKGLDAQLLTKYQQWAKHNQVVGSALSVNGLAVYYGYANKALGKKVDKNTVFGIGSITKTFVSVAILKLEAQNKLDIHDKITDYFPAYKRLGGVTIKQLLQMSAGLNDVANEKDGLNPQQQIAKAYQHYDAKQSGQWLYSNVSYQLLGKLIEKVTREPLAEVISNLLTKPLGMEHTYFPNAHQAKTLFEYQNGQVNTSNYQQAYAAGGLVSNVHDLNSFLNALFVKKSLLPKAQYHELLSFVDTPKAYYAFTKTPAPKFGLGVFQWSVSPFGEVLTYPGVLANGFTTSYVIFKQHVVIIQSNTYNHNNFTLLWPYQPFIRYLIQDSVIAKSA